MNLKTFFAKSLVLGSLLPVSVGAQVADTSRVADTIPGREPTVAPYSTEVSSSGLPTGPESQVFLEALKTILAYHQTTFSDSTLWEQALDGLIEGLNDPYASVFTPDEYGTFQEENTGDYAGIGVQITQLNSRVTVTAVFRQTPADLAGLVVGDQIVEVDGVDAREWTVDQARDSIRGEVGTMVNLAVQRDGMPEPLPMPIRRGRVHVSAVEATMVFDSLGYIAVDRVARGSTAEVDSAFVIVGDAKGVILDLRRNPGGYLVEALTMADLFLPRGETVATTRSRAVGRPNETIEESFRGRVSARLKEKPLVVLVDRFTASGAEIVAGALQDHDRAVVLGERTFGKGVVQTVLPLPEGRRLRITTGSWHTPLGRSLHIPRDLEGRPLQEESDSFPVVVTEAGRTLRADGGVYPDLVLEPDTLTTPEQELLIEAGRAGVPLVLRLTEFAFEESQKAREGKGPPEMTLEAVARFIESLRDEGVPGKVLDHPEAREYLAWRARWAFADRADHKDHKIEFLAERDRVLAEAIRLLRGSGTQNELFGATEATASRMEAERAEAGVGQEGGR